MQEKNPVILTEENEQHALDRPIKAIGRAVDGQVSMDSRMVVMLRLLLYPSEVFHLPRSSRALRVRSGAAWVTSAGRDIIAREGETVPLDRKRGFAIASPLHGRPLVLEVLAGGD